MKNIRTNEEIQNFNSIDGGDSGGAMATNEELSASASAEHDDRSGPVMNNLTNYNPTKN
jgi:hypothetical protein